MTPARPALLREIASLRRDNKLLREISLGMPGVKVVRAAMRWHDMRPVGGRPASAPLKAIYSACVRLAKHRAKGARRER